MSQNLSSDADVNGALRVNSVESDQVLYFFATEDN